MKFLHKNVLLILTRNADLLQELNANHKVKLNANICYSVSFHTVYLRGGQSSEGQKRVTGGRKNDTHTGCVALRVSLHRGTVIIICNIDLLGFLKTIINFR